MGLSGGIISRDQLECHRQAELILHSREAQAMVNSAYANHHRHRGDDGIWVFGPSISDQALEAMEHNFLTKVSVLIPVIGHAWPWPARPGGLPSSHLPRLPDERVQTVAKPHCDRYHYDPCHHPHDSIETNLNLGPGRQTSVRDCGHGRT